MWRFGANTNESGGGRNFTVKSTNAMVNKRKKIVLLKHCLMRNLKKKNIDGILKEHRLDVTSSVTSYIFEEHRKWNDANIREKRKKWN